MQLPINLPKLGLSKDEAAEYCGVSVNTLGRHGPTPTKIGDRTIYDRRVLDLPSHRDRPVGPDTENLPLRPVTPRCSPKPKTFDSQTRTTPRCSGGCAKWALATLTNSHPANGQPPNYPCSAGAIAERVPNRRGGK